MRILIIPTTDWLRHPTPHRHHYLAEYMAEDHDVTALYFDIFKGKKTWHTKADLLHAGGMNFDNLLFYYSINAPIHYQSIKKFIRKSRPDIIIGAHPISNLLAIKAAKKMPRRIRPLCSFDFNDYFPEGSSLYFSSPTVQEIVKKTAEHLLIRNLKSSDIVTTVSAPLQGYAEDNGAKKVVLNTNGVDTRLFKPTTQDKELKEKYGLGTNVIGFVGTVERWFEFEVILDAFKETLEYVPDAQFLLVGGGVKTDYLEEIKKGAKSREIDDRLVTTGLVPYTEVPRYINLMSVCVIPSVPEWLFTSKIGLPNKLFQYSACGKQILTAPHPPTISVGGDAVVPFSSKDDFVREATRLLNEKKPNQAGLSLAKKFDWRIQCNDMMAALQKQLEEIRG